MTGATWLEELTGRGITLWREGDELRCRGPKKTLTPEVLAQLKEHKPEILERLSPAPEAKDTPSRPLLIAKCIHGMTRDECKVCSGFVRWAIADEKHFRRLQAAPEAAWQEFRRMQSAEPWDTEWAGDLISRALRYLNERYVEEADLSGLGPWYDEIVAAGVAEDRERYRKAVRFYVRSGLRAFDQARKGAA